jgi:hypothetical protein
MFELLLIAQNFALSPVIANKVIACEKHLSINVTKAESIKYQECLKKLDLDLEGVKACRQKHLTANDYGVYSQAPLGVRKQYKACLTGTK